uniref:Uncharacterized protein isoform X2 n=1 Tax=Nicotiana tabacum TaxID=4097 RepID=A0A1S4D8C0_TOBAC|nr:PREDICTED: uncharacterized protein LOC107827142 isoform X2 [Nicotiana tabacum]
MTIEEVAREYVYRSIAKKWAASRKKLWHEFKDPLKIKDEIMDNVQVGITQGQWTSFVNYHYKEETQNMCKRNAENRKKQTVPHTGGSKPDSRRTEMMAETGRNPGRAQFYLATHTKNDGSYVNDEAKKYVLVTFMIIINTNNFHGMIYILKISTSFGATFVLYSISSYY